MSKQSSTKPRERNALYQLAAEFKRNQPQATAGQVWAHFAHIAAGGCHELLVGFDAAAGVLSYVPDPMRLGVRAIRRRSFEQQYYRLKHG